MTYKELKRLRPGTLVELTKKGESIGPGVVLGDGRDLVWDMKQESVAVQALKYDSSDWYDKKGCRQTGWLVFRTTDNGPFDVSGVVCYGPA